MTPVELERLRVIEPAGGPRAVPVVVRRQVNSDFPRVARDWLKSVRPTGAYAKVPNETYFHWQNNLIEGCWVDQTCGWLIACNPVDPDQIYGWLCGQQAETLSGTRSLLHYVYVAKPYRRVGLASRLLRTFDGRLFGGDEAARLVVTTAYTDAGRLVFDKLSIPVLYNPYILWGRAAVPRPHLKKRNMRRRDDPVVQSRRQNVIAGFVPGAIVDEESEET